MSQEETFKKYQDHDFANDEKWKDYKVNNLMANNPGLTFTKARLEKF